MVVLLNVPSSLTHGLNEEVAPLCKDLGPYSVVTEEPRILALRNPALPASRYDVWAKDYRFGKNTSPTSGSPAWKEGGAIARAAAAAASHFHGHVPFSATVISYGANAARKVGVAYHRDPSAYTHIASFTLAGEGQLLLRGSGGQGRGGGVVPYDLIPTKAVVMEEADCLDAKHSVTVSANGRLGLVVRFVPEQEM